MDNKKYNVGIYLFDDVEVLDFAGPFEVFAVTAELSDYQYFEVFTISESGQQVKARNGLKVQPDYSFENHPAIDVLIVPGGMGTREVFKHQKPLDWIAKTDTTTHITMSVCTGALLLAKLGLLNNQPATTHHTTFDFLRKVSPTTEVIEDQRFVDNGHVMTAGGIAAGIDLSLHVVEKLFGKEAVAKTLTEMEYGDWRAATV
ncbi:DJ-1/PfpI family protein [Microscilla marina]|uniref:Transcriptional regulator, AraC family n=1 Tax=Microscilla marina ATCC 23134 TaxID=313606 RepID=A1ZDT8_MICM2|nr:DJ-1/PfpI family protein [Microscilla marina]EAY31246.1 transcriptional regulator, AraC family [Microscilla marina ATCC 23134]